MSKDFKAVEFIKQILKERNLNVDTRPSTGFYDLFLKPNTYLLQPILDDSTAIALSQSIKQIENMNENEADALIANLFITRRSGNKATGYVRFYYSSPQTVLIPEGTVVLSDTGLRFLSVSDVSVSKEEMALNIDGGYYYISIQVIAENYGDEYNIDADAIVSTEGVVANVIKVSNQNAFSSGISRETNIELRDRALMAISTRNLLSERSINTQLYENFPSIRNILVVGMNDPEMTRDIIQTDIDSTSFFIHIGGKTDIYVDTGVDGLSSSSSDSTALEIIPASKYRKISNTGSSNSTVNFTDSSGDYVNLSIQPGNLLRLKSGSDPGDYTISSVDSATQITTTSPITFADDNISYEILDMSTTWKSPLIQISQVDRLDPGTLDPSGVLLYDGRGILVDPKLINDGTNPEVIVDGTNGIHCVFEYSNDIWYTKYSNAGIVDVQPKNISSSSSKAISPDISFDSSGNISIVYTSDDSTSDKYDILLTVLDTDGTTIASPNVIISNSNYSYKKPRISSNPNGLNIVAVKNNNILTYSLVDSSDYSNLLTNIDIYNSSFDLFSPQIDTDDNFTYAVSSDDTNIHLFKITSSGLNIFTNSTHGYGSINNDPSVGVDSSSFIYIGWISDSTDVYMSKINNLGSSVIQNKNISSLSEYSKSPRIKIDESDKIHLVVINENRNSGDPNYFKLDNDLSFLVERDLIKDQYNNANRASMTVDSNRRPHIIWDSYDNRNSHIYYCKRQSQDYKIISLDKNYRYSIKEMINIKVDPSYSSDYLRFTYKYASDIEDISEYVFGISSQDNVVVADYLVRYPVPSFVDINIEYSGDDSSAVEIIIDYINNTKSSSISASEIISSLPASVSQRVTIPFIIKSERHNQDGSIAVNESSNIINEPRIVKFISRNIESS